MFCVHIPAQTASKSQSPYERYLPQADPSETNRVQFPEGYSIVKPFGWSTQTIKIDNWFKSSVADQVEIKSSVQDEYPPRITIQHFGPEQYGFYHGLLESTNDLPAGWLQEGWKRIRFQGQPALSQFLPGYGSHQAVRGSYQPWLTRNLYCERDGNGFLLIFDMRNADKNRPYYTEPVPVIEQYLETFQFKKPHQ